jgi:hypothetical protein
MFYGNNLLCSLYRFRFNVQVQIQCSGSRNVTDLQYTQGSCRLCMFANLLRLLIFFMELNCLYVNCNILCIFWQIMNTYLLNLMHKIFKTCMFCVCTAAREPGRVGPSQREARAEPNFPARLQNEPARAEPICSELNAGSHRAQPELARVQPYIQSEGRIEQGNEDARRRHTRKLFFSCNVAVGDALSMQRAGLSKQA